MIIRYDLILTGLLTAVGTLLIHAPIDYFQQSEAAAPIVVVDVQKLLTDEQATQIKQFGDGDPAHMTPEAKSAALQQAGDWAKHLSDAVAQYGAECRCVVVNKAAVLSGSAQDVTPVIATRLSK
ncbi:hypothetical protein [Burkholderia plantarii]|uniref:hypothetical protein n=1 Tax=Burkholderia plantarii TaxID=41899 RepID=UPI0006D88D54|nr:hypothetical protein [Burkholderia plantarii]ALK35174.1 hypothetical protein bpln_1p0280 [Burkholderia plantarii]GLZ22518.1 hypothetical protein Bpla01_60470 [Burkholderia plantarii]